MELDVHLERTNEEFWGFDIAGNPDQNLPLTVIKISPETPAERAGLKCDDIIIKIGDKVVAELTHEDALQAIDDAKEALLLRVTRGLYDPVVEDPEAPFEQYEQPDSDQPSEPTEVFKLEMFEPSPEPTSDPTRPNSLQPSPIGPDSRGPTPFVPTPLEFDRSSTTSPFKFRPFSAEPLPDIPPLEEPILLNPNYQDQFAKSSEDEDIPVETKFKLPVSEQYDPEGNKRKVEKREDMIERKVIKEVSDDILKLIIEKEKKGREIHMGKLNARKTVKEEIKKEEKHKQSILELAKEEKAKQEAKNFMKDVLKDIQIKKMNESAINAVEESIQKTVSITEQVTKDIIDENTNKTSRIRNGIDKETLAETIKRKETNSVEEILHNKSSLKETLDKINIEDFKDTVDNKVNLSEPSFEKIEVKDIEKPKKLVDAIEGMTDEVIKEKIPGVTFVEEEVNEFYDKKVREEKIYPSILEDIEEEKEEAMSDEYKEEDTIVEDAALEVEKQEAIIQEVKKQEEVYKHDETVGNIREPEKEDQQKKEAHTYDDTIVKEVHKEIIKAEMFEKELKCNVKEDTIESYGEVKMSEQLKDIYEKKDTPFSIDTKEEFKTEEVKEEHKFGSYEKKIKDGILCDAVKDAQEDKEPIKNNDIYKIPDLSLQETEEFEIIESTLQDQSTVTKDHKFESFNHDLETVSDVSKEIKKTTTDDSRIKREEIEEVKEDVLEKLPQPKIIQSLDEKEYKTVNKRKESTIISKQLPESVQENTYKESKESKETVYKSERRLSGDIRSEAERRVYTLGLQTIPNIKGVVHSSHFNLLLKTFFIHLTDVMVALSRFILTEPAFSKLEHRETATNESVSVEQEKRDRKVIEERIQKEVDRRVEQKLQEEAYERDEMKKAEMRVAEERQKKQLEEKRQQEMQRIKEVVKEELKEEKTMARETRQESQYIITRPGRQTYRAVVEAHVYTNPEVVFEDYSSEMSNTEIGEMKRLEMQQREKQRLEIERKKEEERVKMQRQEKERMEMKRQEQERMGMQKHEKERMEMHIREHQRREQNRIEKQRREQDRIEMQRREQERLETQRREQQRIEMQKREQQRLEMHRREEQRLEMQRREQQSLELQKREQQRQETQKQERKLEMQRIERERAKRREEQILEMRQKEVLARSSERQQYSRSNLLHEAVQKVEEFIENKRLLEEAIKLQESSRTAIYKQVIKPQAQTYKAIVAPQEYSITTREKEFRKSLSQKREVDKFIHKSLGVKKYTEATKPKFVQENAVQVTSLATKDQLSDLRIVKKEAVEVIKSLVDQKAALEVLNVNTTRDKLRELQVKKQKYYDASKSKIEQRGAVQVIKIKPMADVNKLETIKKTTFETSRSITENRGALKVSTMKPKRNEVSNLKITKQKAKEVVQSLVDQKAVLEVLQVNTVIDEVREIPVTKQPIFDAPKSVIKQHGAFQVTQIESTKDEITNLNITKQKAKEVIQSLVDQKTSLEVLQVESTKDELSKLEFKKQKTVDASQSITEKKSSIKVSAVESRKDEIAELKVIKDKAFDASKKIIEHTAALQVAQVKSSKHQIKELQIPAPKPVAVSQSLIEQNAIQVCEVKSSKNEVSEMNISKQKTVDASKNIIEQRAALQVAEVKTTKNEIKELQVPAPKPVAVSQSLIQQNAIQVCEVKSSKNEVSEMNISKHKTVDASKKIIEHRAALQVAEVKSTKNQIKDLQVPVPKPVAVSQSLVEQTAIQVCEVKSSKDEVSELNVSNEKTVDATKKIIEQRAALQVAEVKSTKHEIKELQVSAPKPVEVSQSLVELTAVQVSEVKSSKDEISELELTKQKAVDISETWIEQTAALQVAEVELTNDEIAELETTTGKVVDASQTIVEQTAAVQVEEVDASNEEIEELEIAKQNTAEVSQSLIEQTAALQIAKVESTKDEVDNLEITEEKTVDASESLIEQRAALKVTKIEAEVDELSQLDVAEAKSFGVKTSLAEARSTAVVIDEIETIKDDLSELRVQEQRKELAKSSEVTVEMDKAVVGKKVPTILDEFAALKVVKYDVQEADEAIHITDKRDSAIQITEVSVESDREVNGLAMSEQRVHIAKSLEVEEARAVTITGQNVELAKSLEIEQKQAVSDIKVQASNDESASLNMIKHQILEVDQAQQMSVESEKRFSSKEIHQSSESYQNSLINEASFTAKLAETQQVIQSSGFQSEASSEMSEPSSPSTQPSTPLTDEYVFRLAIPLPKSRGTTPVPPEPPRVAKTFVVNGEDPHIVKKGLVPHIEAIIEPPIIYDPPLPTPPTSPQKPSSPVYFKPGLKGGCQRPRFQREEIREMKRKSSLLASAIDETIKSIEEYKEDMGIEPKKQVNEEIHITKTVEQKSIVIENGDVKEIKIESNERIETVKENGEASTKDEDGITAEKQDNNTEEGSNILKENVSEAVESKEEAVNEVQDESVPVIQEQNSVIEEKNTSQEDSDTVQIIEIDEEKIKNIESNEVKSVTDIKPENSITVIKTESTELRTKIKESNKTEAQIDEVAKDDIDKEVEAIAEEAEKVEKISEKVGKVEEATVAREKETSEQKIENEKTPESADITKTEFAKKLVKEDENIDYLKMIKPVKFDPEAARSQRSTPVPPVQVSEPNDGRDSKMYVTETGEPLGTIQGIVDGLEEAIVDEEVAKALGKPGMPHEKVAEIASGEADMLREAHVMGLSRVITSHMHRIDEDTTEVQPLKPLVKSLENSEVLRALNEELAMEELKKKKEEKRWTTFLQKPKRPVPRAKFGYYRYVVDEEEDIQEPYQVKIVKQPKPKVAPDYKPEDFDTGPLPWEQRAEIEASLPPIEPEEPILVPEEGPEFLEALDPLPESEVPDLEDTGLPLPVYEPPPVPEIQLQEAIPEVIEVPPEVPLEVPTVEQEEAVNVAMEENKLAEQLTRSVQSMVDPNAPLEQQLIQMRAQLAALAQLPGVIQQTLDLVTNQLLNLSYQGMQQMQQMPMQMSENQVEAQSYERYEESQTEHQVEIQLEQQIENQQLENIEVREFEQNQMNQEEIQPENILSPEEYEVMRREEEARMEEERKSEKQRRDLMQQYENESRRSQMSTPRPNKPKPKFGPLDPEERRRVVPAGRRWRTYDEQAIAETIQAQSELIQGKVLGSSCDKDIKTYGERINFMKYEKPEPSLDHLKNSEVYKVVHNMDETPLKRVELLTPVIAESDYRKRCRSRTPSSRLEERVSFPQQLHP